ncbi:hypothetical protein BH11PSE3_BH11PSE3_45470 [soil metagenome]
MAWTEHISTRNRLFNSLVLVQWNLRKDYIGKLAAAGVRVPGTHFVACETSAIEAVFAETGWARAVVKPATGASGYCVELMTRDEVATSVGRLEGEVRATGVLVQEFLPEIAEGELSLVYFDGAFSHAIRKRPSHGEFRVNSRFGAARARETPSPAVTEQGAAALRVLPERPLYARVDGVVREGLLIVLEVEVLEPALFMEFDPPSAERFAQATVERLRSD